MRYLNASSVRQALPMGDAIDAMRIAFGDDRETPVRHQLGSSLYMTGRVGELSGVKVVSVVPGNPTGLVAVFDGRGSPLGIVDGAALTSIRTGAACGLATDLLASPSAGVLAMLGAGAMAADQIAAVRAVRRIDRVLVWSRSSDRANELAERVGGEVVLDPSEAVAAADIVDCATPATAPLFAAGAVTPGTHFNAVGAFTPDMVELPAALVRDAFVVVDDRAAAAVEAGDLLQANREPDATLGDIVSGRRGRGQGRQPTVFKSVGIASQDIAAAGRALHNAAELGIGVLLDGSTG